MTSAIIVIIFYLIVISAIGIGFILSVMAFWKMSKAHQSLAETLKIIARNMKSYQEY